MSSKLKLKNEDTSLKETYGFDAYFSDEKSYYLTFLVGLNPEVEKIFKTGMREILLKSLYNSLTKYGVVIPDNFYSLRIMRFKITVERTLLKKINKIDPPVKEFTADKELYSTLILNIIAYVIDRKYATEEEILESFKKS